MENPSSKNKIVAILLCFFLGGFGIHRFYTGHTVLGIVYLLTFGIGGFGVIIDFIRMILGSYNDSNGNPFLVRFGVIYTIIF